MLVDILVLENCLGGRIPLPSLFPLLECKIPHVGCAQSHPLQGQALRDLVFFSARLFCDASGLADRK